MSKPIRAVITRFSNRLQEDLQEYRHLVRDEGEGPDDFLDRLKAMKRTLESSIAKLEAKNKEYSDFLGGLDDAELEKEEKMYDAFIQEKNDFLTVLVAAADAVDDLEGKMSATEEESSSVDPSASEESARGRTTAKSITKLPQLALPNFDGDPLNWENFWDNFKTSVDEQPISNIQKFSYLAGCLQGRAKESIEGISLSDKNYAEAKEILQKRFGDKELIKRSLYTQLRKVPKCSNHTTDLRNFFVRVDRICRQLRTQKENVDQSTIMLVVQEKLPAAVLIELGRAKGNSGLWKLQDLLKALENYICLREEAFDITQHTAEREEQPDKRGDFKREYQTRRGQGKSNAYMAAQVTTEEKQQGKRLPCAFCTKAHYNDECPSYKSISERQQQITTLQLCFKCLRQGHKRRDCRFKKACFYCGNANHNRALCPKKFQETFSRKNSEELQASQETGKSQDTVQQSLAERPKESSVYVVACNANKEQEKANKSKDPEGIVLLLTSQVEVKNPAIENKRATITIFMDSGSEKSFITQRLAERLQLKGLFKETLPLFTFASKKPKLIDSTLYEIELVSGKGKNKVIYVSSVPTSTLTSKLRKLASDKNTAMQTYDWTSADALVGNDYFWDFFKDCKVTQQDNGFYKIQTNMFTFITGKSFSGPKGIASPISISEILQVEEQEPLTSTKPTNSNVEEFWNLESIGIRDSPIEKDDDRVLRHFEKTVSFVEGRYEVKWPWKELKPALSNNYGLCYGRLQSLLKRFANSPEILQKYDEVIKDQLRQGIIEPVSEPVSYSSNNGVINYIPHQAVLTLNKATTKVRVVYDASAKSNKKQRSLNEALFRGPVLLPNLCGMYLKARSYRNLVISDVEKAFLQIGLSPEDRDSTRFLWVSDIGKELCSQNLVTYRFTRIAFGVIASPFLLNAVIQYHLEQICKQNPHNRDICRIARQIKENTYVDNLIGGVKDEKDALTYYRVTKDIFRQANMNIREWNSNIRTFTKELPEEDRMSSQAIVTLLGLNWQLESDSLILQLRSPEAGEANEMTWTKRQVSHCLASNYDPLGYLSPVLVKGKAFFQSLCKKGLSWDDALSAADKNEWTSILADWRKNPEFEVSRVANALLAEEVELHVFSDASQTAYATAVYARGSMSKGLVETNLVFAKTRLNPNKEITIPRLELLAVVIGLRALRFVCEHLKVNVTKKVLWTDSSCVMSWLSSSKALPVFVSNRLKEIHKATDVEFRHVEGKSNPADQATRGIGATELKQNDLWWRGPLWLQLDETCWPSKQVYAYQCEESATDEDVPRGQNVSTFSAVIQRDHQVIRWNKYSSWIRLKRIMVYILRFIKKRLWDKLSPGMQHQLAEKCVFINNIQSEGCIQAQEMTVAEKTIIRTVQHEAFEQIFHDLAEEKDNIWINRFGIKLEEGILKCFGRYQNAEIGDAARAPILLSPKHAVTKLIIQEAHETVLHSGVQSTLAEVRQKWWVPKGRQVAKSLIRSCTVCRRFSVTPYRLPIMAPLPGFRSKSSKPFQYTGLDYFGPIKVKFEDQERKVWTGLFTCLTTRAVHLEVVTDLSTERFLSAFRRFIARRGRPEVVCSDNATTFKGAQRTLSNILDSLQQEPSWTAFMSNRGIRWHFITRYSPWRGGYYERMVGLVKSSLKKTVGRRTFSLEDYTTLVCEAEAVVNSRPLTYISDDLETVVLRPIDFLLPRSEVTFPVQEGSPAGDEDYVPPSEKDQLVEGFKKALRGLDRFWRIWQKDYFLSLREKHTMLHKNIKTATKLTPKIGTVVLVEEEGVARAAWKLGKIQELKKDRDDIARAAVVKLADGSTAENSLNFLYPLECEEPAEEEPVLPSQPEHQVYGNETDAPLETANVLPVPAEKDQSTSTKKRVRRSPRRFSFSDLTAYTTVLLVLTFLSQDTKLATAIRTKCSATSSALVEVASQACVTKGIVVMKNRSNKHCWIEKECPNGHLQDGHCKQKCSCPAWASGCSFYEGITPEAVGLADRILEASRPQICSLQKRPVCDFTPNIQKFNQIQLYNGSLFLVENLELVYSEIYGENFVCLGEGARTGSSAFCEINNCLENGTSFCFYKNSEIAYYSHQYGRIPVKAWGVVEKTYYKFRQKRATRCQNCTMMCVRGGVKVGVNFGVDSIEVCAEPYCYIKNRPSTVEVIAFPKEIVLSEYAVQVKFYAKGQQLKLFRLNCEAAPLCEMITCTVCIEMLANPSCVSGWVVVVTLIAIYLAVVLVYVVISILWWVAKSVFCLGKGIICCWKLARRAIQKTYLWTASGVMHTSEEENVELLPRYRSRFARKPLKTSMAGKLAIALAIAVLAEGCSEVTTLNAKSSQCAIDQAGNLECGITEALRIALAPQGQKACVLLKDLEGRPLGTISIKVARIALECQKRTDYYTRSFRMRVTSAKRCAKAGSCIDKKCAGVTRDSKLKEFDAQANEALGITHCVESCGCAACGCFFCSSACFFYRTYVEPVSPTIFELFSCPAWTLAVSLELGIERQNAHQMELLKLRPGVGVEIAGIKLSLISTTIPPAPILFAKFLSDGRRVALVPASPPGIQLVGTIGELQCQTKEKARELQCAMPQDICQCDHGEENVNCACSDHELENLMDSEEMALPLSMPGIVITKANETVDATFSAMVALEVQMEIKGVRMQIKREVNTCDMKIISFSGCFNCLTGAKLRYRCATDFGSAVGHINCGLTEFSVNCASPPVEETIHLSFSHPKVSMECELRCLASQSLVKIEGDLAFLGFAQLTQSSSIVAVSKNFQETVSPDFSLFLGLIQMQYKILALLGLGTILFLYLIWKFLKFFNMPFFFPSKAKSH